jgi:hypothetical protein
MVLNSELYEKLSLKMCITTKVSKIAYTRHLHILNKKHGTSLYLSILWSANKCERDILVYVMYMIWVNTQENEKGREATHKSV